MAETEQRERQVRSRDGTVIAFDRLGVGPAVVLVASALSDRSDAAKLAGRLSERFTVINYDRRGRGKSGDTRPYAVDREIEDLAALIEAAGGSAFVFGSSSGAVLALRAAASGVPMRSLAVFEPPFRVEPSGALPEDFPHTLERLVSSGRRGKAVALFMSREVGVPRPFLLLMRLMPGLWRKLEAMAHTLPYDYAVMGRTTAGEPLDHEEWAAVTVPTLVINGGKSPARMRGAAVALAEVLPDSRLHTLESQRHSAVVTASKPLVDVLTDFFETERA
jgi:pimeloyl-ACP methyl ester carboxylesterase